jgi:hypothetical protein
MKNEIIDTNLCPFAVVTYSSICFDSLQGSDGSRQILQRIINLHASTHSLRYLQKGFIVYGRIFLKLL